MIPGGVRGGTATISAGHVWLEGDSAAPASAAASDTASTDSRSFGAVPMGLLAGRVVARDGRSDNFDNLGPIVWIFLSINLGKMVHSPHL